MENNINTKATAKDTNDTQEIWVNVPDEPYNKTYLISNMGRIKNKNTGQIKSQTVNNSGFSFVRIDIGKKAKKITYQIHQLVAKMFNGECPKNYFVVHKDSNKLNNSASNLKYMTKSEANLRYLNKNKKAIETDKSESSDNSESDTEESKEVKQVISKKAKQQLLEKTTPKKVVKSSESEPDSESEDNNNKTVSLKEYKILQAKNKSLEEENKSLKKQLNIKELDKNPLKKSSNEKSSTENKTISNPDKKPIQENSSYKVDKKGNVYNHDYKLSTHISPSGYNRISLAMNDGTTTKRQNKYVHRLVAEAWIPNPKNLPFVNHINANKIDNRVENLEWCTASQNMLHDSKLRGTGKKIYAFDSKTGKFYKSFESIKAAGREIGVDSTTITKVISGDRLLGGGYFWKQGEYDNEDDISDIDEELLEQAKKLDRYRKNKIAPKKETKDDSSDSSESESESDS